MDKKKFIQTITIILAEHGFKKVPRTNHHWKKAGSDFDKVIYIYKSYYSNSYLMIYAFHFKGLSYDKNIFDIEAPIHNGSTGKDIESIFDLDTEISDEEREQGLKDILEMVMVQRFEGIETVGDLYEELISQKYTFRVLNSAREKLQQSGYDESLIK